MSADIPQWLQTAQQKRQTRDDAIRTIEATLANEAAPAPAQSESTQDTGATAIDHVDRIQLALSTRAVTARELCAAYITRAITAHRRTNCLTEVLFDQALQRADELDSFFAKNGRLVGPLHGVPMTLKDQFDVQGYDSSLGYVGRTSKPAAEDCVLVALLKQLGAVVIAKSNLPQSIMWCETENPLWGLTVHPNNPDFTPGGSTGGEGTLLHAKGSVVGWGTDIGGSIRIPSHMLGLYGLKPSVSGWLQVFTSCDHFRVHGPVIFASTRLPYHGVQVSTEGQEHVPSVVGPMSRNIESLIAATKAIVNASPWNLDPKCCPLPWRSGTYIEVQTRPLVVGVMYDDGVVKTHPPIARVLQEVAAKLEAAGHELVPWTPGTLHQECIDIMDQYYTADGGEDIRRDIQAGGEPFIPHVEGLVNKGKPISVYDYWQLNKRKFAAQKKFLNLWNSTVSPKTGQKIDVLLTPVMPHSAVPHRKCRWVGYTKIFNFVDYPAVVVPAGQVSRELDSASTADMDAYEPRNALDKWNWDLFDLDSMGGMPIGVQVIARRLEEEKVLGAAKVIDELIKTTNTK